MNKNFIFFIIACSLFILSIITVNVAPIISKADSIITVDNRDVSFFEGWGNANCKKLDDDYKYKRDIRKYYDEENKKPEEDQDKRIISECKNHKIMYSLEYAALIIDVSLGFICTFLGLINYLEPGKPFEKNSGLIGLISGIVVAVLTVVYVAFSANIFSNEPIRYIKKLYSNKASLHYNGVDKYIYDYDEEKAVNDDLDTPFIKYKDLGKKQYNYDSEIFQSSKDSKSEYYHCHFNFETSFPTAIPVKYTIEANDHECIYLWNDKNFDNTSINNKFLYDRWLTSIILSVLIAVCGIGLVIFGFLLFTGSNNSEPSPSTIPA